MFIAIYKEYEHGRNRDNYDTCKLEEADALSALTMEELLNKMFDTQAYHDGSKKRGHYEYDYTSIEWMGVHEIEIKDTIYQSFDSWGIDCDPKWPIQESELLEMVANSGKGKKVAIEAEIKRKEQEEKKKADAVIRKQKRIEAKARKVERDELKDREDYDRLKLKYEGDDR